MPDYRQMYLTLFNAVTDAIERLKSRNSFAALGLLIAAQQATEKLYITEKDEE